MNLVFPAPAASNVPTLSRRIRIREILTNYDQGKILLNIVREYLDINGDVFGSAEYLGTVQVPTIPNDAENAAFLLQEADCIQNPTKTKLEDVAEYILIHNGLIDDSNI